MGIAIVKGEYGSKALNRTRLNVTPKNASKRIPITNNMSDTVWELLNGVYKVAYINIGLATQHYLYKLCDRLGNILQSLTGVNINEITGTIRLDSNYDGSAVYAKVVPLIVNQGGIYEEDCYTTAINTSAVLVKAEEVVIHTYSLQIAYNNFQSVSAQEQDIDLTDFVLTKDGDTVIADVTEMDTAVRNDELSVSTNVISLGTTWVNSSNVRNIHIAKNNGGVREATLRVVCVYEGTTIYSNEFSLMLGAKTLSSVNNVTYTGDTTIGTTINVNNISATGTYSNGDTETVHPTSVNPTEIASGENSYTLTFASGVTATIQITGQLAVVSKAYISGVENPYPTKDANSYSWPLYVEVTHSDGTVENMKFTDYNSLNEVKETYADPVVTYANNGSHANSGLIDSLTGTMSFDFSNTNYIYDHSRVLNISITCTSNSERSASTTSNNGYSERYLSDNAHDFFDNNFTKVLLTTDNYLSISSKTLHISNDRSDIANGTIMLSDSGTAYYLDKTKLANDGISTTDFYIGVSGFEGAIISNISNNVNTSTTYSFRPKADVKLIRPESNSRIVYAHHTPSNSSYTTYLITFDYLGSLQAVWYLFVPKNSEYSPITITSGLSVSPSSLPASGGTITITPPTYSLTHGSETITSGANITYTLDGVTVTPTNNTLLLSENLTNLERTRVLVATIELNGRTATSSVNITQAANTSVTVPAITSINSNPYDINTGGVLVTSDNKEQIEFPLQITLSNGTSTTLENYQNTYGANSLYSNVTIQKASSSSDSTGAYPNDFKINLVNGNIIYDFKDDSFAWDRSKITSITINGKTGVSNVTLNSGIPSIYAHLSSLFTTHFEEKLNWTSLSFISDTKYKLDISSDDGATRLGLQTSSSANRLKKLTAASDGAYYIRFKSTDWPTIAVFELPQGTTISTDLDLRNVNKRVLRIGGNPETLATDWKYIKLTPTTSNADIYYVDNVDSSSTRDVQLGSIKND